MVSRFGLKVRQISLLFMALLLIGFCATRAIGRTYNWPDPENNVVLGKNTFYVTKDNETYAQIAAKEDVAYDNLNAANPGLGPQHMNLDQIYQPHPGTVLLLPTKVLLPSISHKGIVVNVAEKQLYYFQPKKHLVYVYPIGVGRSDWETPLGSLHIYEKIKNPVWIVPDSIMQYREKRGDPISKIVQSGPENPLGYFALRLSNHSYLIHGTNEPTGVGRRSSAGCIRLYADDIKQLFSMVRVNTPVMIINEPFKVAIDKKTSRVYASFHRPFAEEKLLLDDPISGVKHIFKENKISNIYTLSYKSINQQLKLMTGIPFSPSNDVVTVADGTVSSVLANDY